MDKLTLDTNVLRDWAWIEGLSFDSRYSNDLYKKEELRLLFSKLIKYRNSGNCHIAITNQIFTDFEKEVCEIPPFIDVMIGSQVSLAIPSISTFPMIFPFVFIDEDMINIFLKVIFPGSKPTHNKYPKNRKDALQIIAHYEAKRDFFITSDKGILNSRERLLSRWKIHVISLREYITMTQST